MNLSFGNSGLGMSMRSVFGRSTQRDEARDAGRGGGNAMSQEDLNKKPDQGPLPMAGRAAIPESAARSSVLQNMTHVDMYLRDNAAEEADPAEARESAKKSPDMSELQAPRFVDTKSYETTVFKRGQSSRVVKHALTHKGDAEALFTKYVATGNSGPESRMNKLHDAIDKIPDTDRREALLFDFAGVLDPSQLVAQALLHEENAVSLFSAYVSSNPEGQGAALDTLSTEIGKLPWNESPKLTPVLDSLLADMARSKGGDVAASLIASEGFSVGFSQVSAENKLSDEEGLAQLSKDFERGVSFTAPEGVSLETLPDEARAFIGRFANQQSAAALVTDGALNVADRVSDSLSGSGFLLDGWNSANAGVSYNVSVDTSGGVCISIPTTIGIKPTVMSEVASLPVCVATLEMTMTPAESGGQAYAVNVSFSPYTA